MTDSNLVVWLRKRIPGAPSVVRLNFLVGKTVDSWIDKALIEWISINIIGERRFPSHQPSNFVALYNALAMDRPEKGYDLMDMLASVSNDFRAVIQDYVKGDREFWQLMEAATGRDYKAIADQWRGENLVPVIEISEVDGGYSLKQMNQDGQLRYVLIKAFHVQC